MSAQFEAVMEALFSRLQNAATVSFTANATASSAVLSNVSSFAGLFAGLIVQGSGIPADAAIVSFDAVAQTVTLSAAASAGATAATFTTTGFLTTGRRVLPWTEVSEQPALFLRRVGSEDQYSGTLPITTLECEVWIYSQAGQDPDAIPDETLSNLDMLVRQSLAPDDDDRCTLGGLVYWCRVEGRSDYSPGDLGAQGISRIPVRITLP